jgi:pimeloyl-ACP methyl ester carboxylesterase
MASMNRFDILRNAVQINIPCLLIHGTKDEAVPVEEVWALKKKIRHSEILLIESSNHTFGCKHPFMGQLLPTDASEVVQKTILFLQRNR